MRVTKEIAKSLKELQRTWKQTEAKTGGSNLPDNDYSAKITNMEINVSKNGRVQVITTLKIVDGKFKNKECMKFDGIDSDTNMSWFKGYCEVLGIEIPESITDLPNTLEEFVSENKNAIYNITLKTKNDYQNILVKGSDIEEDEDVEEDVEEDEDEDVEDEDEDEDEDEEDEDEEDEEVKPKKKKKKK